MSFLGSDKVGFCDTFKFNEGDVLIDCNASTFFNSASGTFSEESSVGDARGVTDSVSFDDVKEDSCVEEPIVGREGETFKESSVTVLGTIFAFSSRKVRSVKYVQINGIQNYEGKANQNIALLNERNQLF